MQKKPKFDTQTQATPLSDKIAEWKVIEMEEITRILAHLAPKTVNNCEFASF